MKSITKAQYAMLFFAVDRLKEDSWYTGPYGFDALKERGLVDFGQHDRIITDEGITFVKRMLADSESMPMTAKRAIAEYDVLRDEYAHLFEHDPDMRVRVAMFGVHGLEPVEPPTGIDGFRTDTIYNFKDLDVLSATFAITHLYSGFNPNHHVIVRAHESYTDPPAPVIDSINNRQLRQSGGTISESIQNRIGQGEVMSVERIIVETNDETGNNPVEYDWEFDPDGVSRMTGEGDIPSGADNSTAIVDGERIASGGDAKWLRPLAAMLAARIPFVSGSVESGLSVDITSSEFLDCCRSVWIGVDMHRGFGRYLNLRWDVGRREWVEASSGFAFVGADSQVAFHVGDRHGRE